MFFALSCQQTDKQDIIIPPLLLSRALSATACSSPVSSDTTICLHCYNNCYSLMEGLHGVRLCSIMLACIVFQSEPHVSSLLQIMPTTNTSQAVERGRHPSLFRVCVMCWQTKVQEHRHLCSNDNTYSLKANEKLKQQQMQL